MRKRKIDTYTLLKFIFHQTKPEEDRAVAEWLDEDKSRYSSLEKLIRTKSDISPDANKEWVKQDYLLIQSRINRPKSRRRFLHIAAAFLGLILAAFSVYLFVDLNRTEWKTMVVAKGERNDVLLPDGTKVWLAPDTKFHYPVKFASSIREVRLEGQGYFDVAHDQNCPFVVHTTFSDVEVLGTKFNVKAYPNEINTTTVLVEGKVNIGYLNREQKRIGEQLLYPSQKSNYNIMTQKFNVHKVELKHELAWRNHRLSFRNETFREIANKIERHYNMTVIFKDGQLTNKRFTGEFRDETVQEVLETFKEWTSFEYEIINKTIQLKK